MVENRPHDIWIVGAKRTAFGRVGGTLGSFSATQLGVVAAKAALQQSQVNPSSIDTVVFGTCHPTAADTLYISRHVGLRIGAPSSTSALVVNLACGSGFQALISASQQIILREANVAIAGGSEAMSLSPHVKWGQAPSTVQYPNKYFEQMDQLGRNRFGEMLWDSLIDTYIESSQAMTTENIARKFKITREESDDYSLRSRHAWDHANESQKFDLEIVATEVTTQNMVSRFLVDENPRPPVAEQC